jgi:hypothetical protein
VSTKTIDEHIAEIKDWIDEACEENPEVNPSDVEGDILISYIACEIVGGERSTMAKQIRRRFGR